MWRPRDFVLRGQFCPLEEIQKLVDGLRRELGAEFLFHMAADSDTILRPLTFVSPQKNLARSVVLPEYFEENTSRRTLIGHLPGGTGAPPAPISAPEGQPLLAALADVLDQLSLPPQPRLFMMPLDSSGGEVQSVLIVGGPWDEPPPVPAPTAELLATMVNGTAQASTRRDTRVMTLAAEALALPQPRTSQLQFSTFAEKAVGLALSVTKSDAGAVYFVSPDQTGTIDRLVQAVRVPGEFATHTRITDDTLIAWAIRRHRAVQDPPGPPDRLPIHSLFSSGGSGYELVTPVSGPLGSPASFAIGALSLLRISPSAMPFSAYDLALIRNLCLRLSLIRNTVAASEIAASISELRARHRSNDVPHLLLPAQLQIILPSDVAQATSRIQPTLERLAKNTNSHSVSLRIALPDPSAREAHGLSLVRVGAYPAELLANAVTFRRQSSNPGLAWLVAQHGTAIDIPDTKEHRDVWKNYKGSRSHVCVPVRVEGSLIGVLSLSSTLEDNYRPFLPLIQAFSGAIGRTIADASSDLMERVLDRAGRVLDLWHSINKDLKRMETELNKGSIGVDTLGPVHVHLQEAQAHLRAVRITEDIEPAGPISLDSILRGAQTMARVMLEIQNSVRERLNQVLLTSAQASLLQSALVNILVNIKDHSNPAPLRNSGYKYRDVDIQNVDWDGRGCVALAFTSESLKRLHPKVLAHMYRLPILDSDGTLRLGAFLAGLQVKRMGGTVHASTVNGNPRRLRTRILFPLEKRTSGGD